MLTDKYTQLFQSQLSYINNVAEHDHSTSRPDLMYHLYISLVDAFTSTRCAILS
jgi:hypothetical protein